MTASEDSESQFSSEAAGTDQPRDDLEHWLSDLRTEAAAGSSGWADEDSADERPPGQADPLPPEPREADASQPSGGGRHRAAD